jgi:hypothetical protein
MVALSAGVSPPAVSIPMRFIVNGALALDPMAPNVPTHEGSHFPPRLEENNDDGVR